MCEATATNSSIISSAASMHSGNYHGRKQGNVESSTLVCAIMSMNAQSADIYSR